MKKRVPDQKQFAQKKEEEDKIDQPIVKTATNPALQIFDSTLHSDLFAARCHDTGQTISVENAKAFKEQIMRKNMKNDEHTLNFFSMRLGINSIIALANSLTSGSLQKLNLADNAISDYGMHAIKNIINNTGVRALILASNMISGDGLELLIDDLMKNTTLKHLDLGILEGSIRKNSLGIQGAMCISAILIKNKTLQRLALVDNDFGPDGGECLGIALAQNSSLKHLRVSENDLHTEGALPIIKNSTNLESLNLSKNFIKADAGKLLAKLLKATGYLTKLQLEFNELMLEGARWIAKGLLKNTTLSVLNLKGNIIGDEGCELIAESLRFNKSMVELDLSFNQITLNGFLTLCEVLPLCKLQSLLFSRNHIGDDGASAFASVLSDGLNPSNVSKFDFSGCKISDTGLVNLLSSLSTNKQITNVKLGENFLSENIEALLLEVMNKNTSIVQMSLPGNRLSHSCLSKIKKIVTRNVRIIEQQEPNRLKAEIYRLRYEQKKLNEAKSALDKQKQNIERVISFKEDVIQQIESHKNREANRREELQMKIKQQRRLIKEKRDQIEGKNKKLQEMEEDYDSKIEELKKQYQEQQRTKRGLETELDKMREELHVIDVEYPQKIKELRQEIENTKRRTADYDERSKQLASQLRALKAKSD